eukprot:gnl/Trimastix_PCT/2919.p1 GENE.gnl/Trimastix_PCT/2919~~gnl/Trimastix_PCT/2919.p1  ORF type:complete len:268 (-),score=55.26 gnl/Trimastix_PCT/2919:29-781(-)
MAENKKLFDRVAVVTGAANGIGRSISKILAEEGCHVAGIDLDEAGLQETKTLVEATGRQFGTYIGSVGDGATVTRIVGEIMERFGRIDVLINNAGITRDGFLMKMTEAAWDAVINVNLKGVFLMTQACGQHMNQANRGSIVNISSIVGKTGNLGQLNYTATKSGVIGMTKTTAKEMARYHVRCNAILPGFINTPMVQHVPQKVIDRIVPQVPLARLGEPDEIAKAVLFLASDDSSYVTGAQLEVTGGLWM